MKRLWAVLFLCAGSLLSAQEFSDVTLYFAPTSGGTPEEREFFDSNLPLEIKNLHYRVVETVEEADFLVRTVITESEDEASPSTLTMGLTAYAGESPLLELTWNFADTLEMYNWNIGEILAPASMTLDPAPWLDNWRQQTQCLYIGFRGGGSYTARYFQANAGYYSRYSAGISAEGGVVVELRLLRFLRFLRFLSIQLEGDFTYETFNAPGTVLEAGGHSADALSFSFISFPLVAKALLRFERLVVSLYGGGYYVLCLGGQTTAGASGETKNTTVAMTLPAGFTAGADFGFIIGSGELFADVRYGQDFGATVIGDGRESPNVRDKVSVCFGYRYGLW